MTFAIVASLCCLLIILTNARTSALFFHLGETEKKCFIEDIPDETIVEGIYKVEMFDRIQNRYTLTLAGIGMLVEVLDDNKNVLMSKTYSAQGRFTFVSQNAGEHTICLHSNSTAWFSSSQLFTVINSFGSGDVVKQQRKRVHLDLKVGENAADYAEIAAKDKLTELQLRVRQLLNQADHISKEQNYQRSREEEFRSTSDSTNSRVLWWAIAQTVLLIASSVFQIHHLKRFFQAKKLV